jgi:hypothetical protein
MNNLTQRRQGAKTRKGQLLCFLCAFYDFAPLREMLLLIQGLFHSFKPMSGPPGLMAIEDNFGADIDYAMLVKVYGTEEREAGAPEWYGPPRVIAAMPTPITGKPNPRYISTSYIERQNLTIRMQARRFTRLTNAFSKKLSNLKAQVALHFAHYNFVRIHQTLRCSPGMAAGLTDHLWALDDLVLA